MVRVHLVAGVSRPQQVLPIQGRYALKSARMTVPEPVRPQRVRRLPRLRRTGVIRSRRITAPITRHRIEWPTSDSDSVSSSSSERTINQILGIIDEHGDDGSDGRYRGRPVEELGWEEYFSPESSDEDHYL